MQFPKVGEGEEGDKLIDKRGEVEKRWNYHRDWWGFRFFRQNNNVCLGDGTKQYKGSEQTRIL